jgi:serine/threonine protein kinase/ABC-type phosphate/phosphonate transport system substrate-binding protein
MSRARLCSRCGQAIPASNSLDECPLCLITMATALETANSSLGSPLSPGVGRRFGDFILGRQLGSGGMGVVYEATQISLPRQVALKFIRDSQVASPTSLRRFTIEAEAAARLKHPNIVAIHEIGEIEGQPFFSMDLIEGQSLRAAIAAGTFAPSTDDASKSNTRRRHVAVARLIAKTARALDHAHLRGILHRDVKPGNILLDVAGEPHLTDFGLAKILRPVSEERQDAERLTEPGVIAGTPDYMSPEQVTHNVVTQVSDIYSLGAVLYELLTGRPPFRGGTPLEIMQRVQNHSARAPRTICPQIEPDLETICLKCLEKDPRHRFVSAEALADDLENWIANRPIHARPPGPLVRITQWTRRNRAGAALIGVLTLALTGSLFVLHVINQQKKSIELHQGEIWQERATQLFQDWADPECQFIELSSKTLDALGNRTPMEMPAALTLKFGVQHADPVNFAQQNTDFFIAMERILGARLKKVVRLEMTVFKSELPSFPTNPAVDIALLSAPVFLRAQQAGAVVPVAQKKRSRDVVIMVNAESGINSLTALKGRSVRFHRPQDTLTIMAKALLRDGGLFATDFEEIVYAEEGPRPRLRMRTIAESVLRGEIVAGATLERSFNLERPRSPGLIQLARTTIAPAVYAVRPGLPADLVQALRVALIESPVTPTEESEDSPAGAPYEESISGAADFDPALFDRFEDARRKAAEFDRKD